MNRAAGTDEAHHGASSMTASPQRAGRRNRMTRALLAILSVVMLALVFLSYLRPGFVLDLANRFILCF
jgi:hypothetical protein